VIGPDVCSGQRAAQKRSAPSRCS